MCWEWVRGVDGVASAVQEVPRVRPVPGIPGALLQCGGVACVLAAMRMKKKPQMNSRTIMGVLALSCVLTSGCASTTCMTGRPRWMDKATQIQVGMDREKAVQLIPESAFVSCLAAGGTRLERYDVGANWSVTLHFRCPRFEYDSKPNDKVIRWEIRQGSELIEQSSKPAIREQE